MYMNCEYHCHLIIALKWNLHLVKGGTNTTRFKNWHNMRSRNVQDRQEFHFERMASNASLYYVHQSLTFHTPYLPLIPKKLANAKTFGFTTGSAVEPCTQGIHIWVLKKQHGEGKEGMTYVLLDTEV